jgi:hypothetical protein
MTRRIETARRLGDFPAVGLESSNLSMVERQGNAWPLDEAPHFAHSRAAVTAAMDRERLQQAWSGGRNMPPADAVRWCQDPTAAVSAGRSRRMMARGRARGAKHAQRGQGRAASGA